MKKKKPTDHGVLNPNSYNYSIAPYLKLWDHHGRGLERL